MTNNYLTRNTPAANSAWRTSPASTSSFAANSRGAYLDRQSRFAAISDRRAGNWDPFLGCARPWFWFYDGLMPLIDDADAEAVALDTAIIDLWG